MGVNARHQRARPLLAHVGDLAIWRQDYAAAEGIYTSVVRMLPDNAVALNNLAVVTSKQYGTFLQPSARVRGSRPQ